MAVKETYFTGEGIGDYIYLHSGTKFYIANPKSEDIHIEDVAHSLSRLIRYTGHIDRFYTVGEHSILCAKLAEELGCSVKMQMYCLLHDVSEFAVNDLNSIVKKYVTGYKELEQKIMDATWDFAGLEYPTKEEYDVIKVIDYTLLINEMRQLIGHKDYPNVPYIDIAVDFGEEKEIKEVKEEFISLYSKLHEKLLA